MLVGAPVTQKWLKVSFSSMHHLKMHTSKVWSALAASALLATCFQSIKKMQQYYEDVEKSLCFHRLWDGHFWFCLSCVRCLYSLVVLSRCQVDLPTMRQSTNLYFSMFLLSLTQTVWVRKQNWKKILTSPADVFHSAPSTLGPWACKRMALLLLLIALNQSH